jgi:hypothetical protein
MHLFGWKDGWNSGFGLKVVFIFTGAESGGAKAAIASLAFTVAESIFVPSRGDVLRVVEN